MSAHTPGPWVLGEATSTIPIKADRKTVASVRYRENDLDDARLITAAPDLLSALRAVNDAYSFISENAPAPMVHAIRKARAAIAKADGSCTP